MTSHSPQGFAVLPAKIARDPTIEPILKAILLALSSFAGADQSCYPSNKTLCDCTGLSERAVREWLAEGSKRGLLTVHRRTMDNGAPASNLYSLNFAKWGDSLTRQMVPGVSADSAGGVGRHGAPGGAQPCPRWGATVPPNNTNDQDQENITIEQDTPLPVVAAPAKVSKQASLIDDEPKPTRQGADMAGADSLIAAWRRLCPDAPQPKGEVGSAAHKAAIAAWKREPDLALWESRFRKVPLSDLLSGRAKSWRADFLWVTKPLNVEKIDAGNYENRQPRNGPGPGMMRTPAGWMPEPERKYDEPDVLF